MNIKQQVTAKMNEGQESDVIPYSWRTIPKSLRIFWLNYFREKKKNS